MTSWQGGSDFFGAIKGQANLSLSMRVDATGQM
jgi:hypothetical protein